MLLDTSVEWQYSETRSRQRCPAHLTRTLAVLLAQLEPKHGVCMNTSPSVVFTSFLPSITHSITHTRMHAQTLQCPKL